MLKKLTPVLIVDEVEPVVAFWAAVGMKAVVEVPHGDRLGFVILKGDEIELMYQSIASVREDEPRVLEGPRGPRASAVYIEVDDLDAVTARFPSATDVIVRGRTTFYGATETIVHDPAGNVVSFAQMQRG